MREILHFCRDNNIFLLADEVGGENTGFFLGGQCYM